MGGKYLQVIPKGAKEQRGILWHESYPGAQSGQGHLRYITTANYNFAVLQFNKPENIRNIVGWVISQES